MGKVRVDVMIRKDIQDKIYASQAFASYKSANDQQKEDYYFSRNLNCEANGEKIDSDSLFSYSVKALKIKQALDGLIDTKYDLHILLVGTVLQPLMLSVSAINSENILLLYDLDGTAKKKDALKDYIASYKLEIAKCEAVNSSEPHTVFTAIKKIVEAKEWNGKKICIDITGGKKTMVGGGFLASSILGIDTYYIDFEKYENGHPVICTEFLNKLDNPYDIYNIQLLNQAKELFKYYNYQAAFKILLEIENKLTPDGLDKSAKYGLDSEKSKVVKMKRAARCYMYWDRFDYECAWKYQSVLCGSQKTHLNNLILFKKIDTKKERYQSGYLYDFIIDRILSAKRRALSDISQYEYKGDYHDAVFRYAQCLEILIETYITRKVSNYDPDVKSKSIYSISGKRELVFKGRKKSEKDNEDNRIDFQMDPIDDPGNELQKKTKSLSDRRDDFAHVRIQKQKSNIQEAEEVIMKFMEIVFEKKSEIIDHDLEEYAFYKYFDDYGSLCKSSNVK